MPMMTRELLKLENTGHAGINSLFSKAHSMDWDLDRDVDWDIEISPDDPCIDPEWASFGRTATYGGLPEPVRNSLARRELARTINVLQVGESVAQDVCAKLALVCEKEDHRNHAVAQAMDEARHHMAYARFLALMGEEPEPIDGPTEAMFDSLLVSDDPVTLVMGEQFFLESMAMPLFERLVDHSINPLLKDIARFIKRDESRHVGFGVLFIAEHVKSLSEDDRLSFASSWMPRIMQVLDGSPGPRVAERMARRLGALGVDDPVGKAERMLEEQLKLNANERNEATSGRRVPHLLASCRRAGLLDPAILEPLGLSEHPMIDGARYGALPAA